MVEILESYEQTIIDRKKQMIKIVQEVITELNRIASLSCGLRVAPVVEIDDGLVEIAETAYQQSLWLSFVKEWLEATP